MAFHFFKRDERPKCERYIKTNGINVDIAGINIGGFELGKLKVESKLLRAVGHALLILDAHQYDLCNSIRNIGDRSLRDKYYSMMVESKLRSQKFIETLAQLSENPDSKDLHEELQKSLASVANDVVDIEEEEESKKKEKEKEKPVTYSSSSTQEEELSPGAIALGESSFRDKVQSLGKFDPGPEPAVPQESKAAKGQDQQQSTATIQQELAELEDLIIDANDMYTDVLVKGKAVLDVWESLAPRIPRLALKPKIRTLAGRNNIDYLNNLLINFSTLSEEFKEANTLGDANRTGILQRKMRAVVYQVLQQLDLIHASLTGGGGGGGGSI